MSWDDELEWWAEMMSWDDELGQWVGMMKWDDELGWSSQLIASAKLGKWDGELGWSSQLISFPCKKLVISQLLTQSFVFIWLLKRKDLSDSLSCKNLFWAFLFFSEKTNRFFSDFALILQKSKAKQLFFLNSIQNRAFWFKNQKDLFGWKVKKIFGSKVKKIFLDQKSKRSFWFETVWKGVDTREVSIWQKFLHRWFWLNSTIWS